MRLQPRRRIRRRGYAAIATNILIHLSSISKRQVSRFPGQSSRKDFAGHRCVSFLIPSWWLAVNRDHLDHKNEGHQNRGQLSKAGRLFPRIDAQPGKH